MVVYDRIDGKSDGLTGIHLELICNFFFFNRCCVMNIVRFVIIISIITIIMYYYLLSCRLIGIFFFSLQSFLQSFERMYS